MSTFDGPIREIPGVSVDRFDGENLKSSTFFLSHCHTDHMRGLQATQFQQKVISEGRYLYLSSVSAVILSALHPGLRTRLKVLPLEQVTSIELQDGLHVAVTCVPAGHCPGSVMFLFETNKCRILYTGDYRIHPSDIKKFNCFYDTFSNVKVVDKIYLDTTFFLEAHSMFPKRETSLLELCNLILSWISQDPENTVKLDLRARYGYEYVFKEIYRICKLPVHVDEEKFKFYSVIPELDQCVTTNGLSTQIHNCYYEARDVCYSCDVDKVRIIKLSAFRWQNDDFKRGVTELGEDGIFYVCYSTHASYEEGLALLNFLQPNEVHMCVDRPNDPETSLKIRKLIDKQLSKIKPQDKCAKLPKLFDISGLKVENSSRQESSPPRKFAKIDSILNSPPR